ncbi:MAG: MFS transporter [Vulcanimicrobiaceae bacterium]
MQLVWGAILAVSLQARSIELAPHDGVRTYATLASIGALLATLVQLAAGRLSDARRRRTGDRRAFYTLGILGGLPALVWFYLAPNLAQLTAAFFALEIALNVALGPYQAAIPDYVAPRRRGLASSWMAAYQSVGNAAGLLVAGFLHDLRVVALALGAPLFVSYRVTLAHVRRLAAQPAESRRTLRLRGPLGVLLLSRGLTNVGFYTLLGFLLFYVRDSLRVTGTAVQTQTALLFLTFTLTAIGGAVLAARPTDRLDKRIVASAANALLIAALAVFALAPNLGVAYGAALLAGIAWGAFVTADWALASAVLPPGSMATAMGIWNVATTVPQVVAPILSAPLLVHFDAVAAGLGPRVAFGVALVEFALGAASIWLLPRV